MPAGLPSFISAVPVPLTSRSCSPAVCQCHGTTQPAANFSISAADPFDGSPRCTATFMQVGNPGKFTNLLVFAGAKVIPLLSCAASDTGRQHTTTNNAPHIRSLMPTPHTEFDIGERISEKSATANRIAMAILRANIRLSHYRRVLGANLVEDAYFARLGVGILVHTQILFRQFVDVL